jgi:SAM-dependent methyltransferase
MIARWRLVASTPRRSGVASTSDRTSAVGPRSWKALYARVPFRGDWTALDLGAGSGFYSRTLRRRAGQVIALDVDGEVMAPLAASGLRTVVADLDAPIPLASETADFVNCLEVLEHLRRPLALLDEIRRLLKPNGFALLSTPNRASLESFKRRFLGWATATRWTAWDDTHRTIFSYRQIVSEVGRRLEILESGGYYYGVLSFRNHHLPPGLWRLYCRLPLLRALGFNTVLLAHKAPGAAAP